ncbi:NUDIX domain-containing protein [Actinomadura rubrisoli]|uniref:NUDIX domain-containing protein n=1 Tax=Actinomadura rubrisoli TaxID=2530368 RepID=A0A4R5AFR8_9ACTN|nr:NUDIX domain-containing protein [Actinomadura rubrisoli]TDD71438.1 NUDIX domain-containing protein [Actinomadura rubrisoli]
MPSIGAGSSGQLTALSPIRLEFAQKAFIVARGSLLLVRKSMSDPFHPGRWEVPGGRLEVEGDLDLDDHLRREVWEEVGLKIDPGPPFHQWQWYMPDRAPGFGSGRVPVVGQVRVVATARRCRPVTLDASLDNQEAGDHLAECAWVPLDDVEGYELIPSLRPVMRAFLSLPG